MASSPNMRSDLCFLRDEVSGGPVKSSKLNANTEKKLKKRLLTDPWDIVKIKTFCLK